ncbi:Autoinducer 2 sensor kinase/phosphatase LuxQ [Pigmentiphaga humi]|uniref:Virulence sensor protein BvgS n=1 Tax=Pigmentiphaga humi TaxID=2478468 RepID=A0A3P4AVS9_9BURK|nr:ATP-binding protein [Pigmentiphaga humi]VCU68123.1 Autoinducer 2 sensor kinase/phosphatase LuxQ [Pigmentiphaga humi]
MQPSEPAAPRTECLMADDASAARILQRSEDRYRLLFESTDQGFCVVQMLFEHGEPVDYRFLEINPAFVVQAGLHDALGKRIRELVPDHERYWFQIYGQVALTGEPVRFDHCAQAMGRWFDVYACRCGDPRDATVAILFSDVTARHAMEAQREQLLEAERAARQAAETATRLKDEFLATLSHELRTPLSVIVGWGQLLLKRADPDNEALRKGLSTILQSAHTQATLISDMLDMSAIFLGKVKLDLAPVNGFAYVAQVVQSAGPSMQGKGISLAFQPSFEVCLVRADSSRLEQILWNLLSNAIKFTPSGGRIGVSARRVGARFEIEVADTGVGIDPEFLPYLFERFRQADGSISRRHGGLGLGLSIVQQLVAMHGGEVWAESEGEGLGACFTVSLPVHEHAVGDIPLHDEAWGEPQHAGCLAELGILAVEDQPDMLEHLVRLLQEYGAEVTGVTSAHAALEELARAQPGRYAVMVADVGMPDMDGYQLMETVRRDMGLDAQALRAVAVTALARDDDRRRALESGFQAHVSKPYRPVALIAAIRGWQGVAGQPVPASGTGS